MDPFPIAYLAGSFPLRSETFVWREVRALRSRGWPVHTFGLHKPDEQTPPELFELRDATRYVYGRVAPEPVSNARAESPASNGRGPRIVDPLPRALHDALRPLERTRLVDRAKLLAQARAGARLARQLRALGVRHVHAHFAHAPASVAMYAALAAGITFSFTGHANDLFQRRQLLQHKLKRAAFVSCISEWHRELYRSIHPTGRYEIIRCGVDLADYGPPPAPAADGSLRVLAVARLVEKKGIDTLVQAAASVEAVQVTIAGDGPERESLNRLARDAGVVGRIRFLGPVDPSTVPGLLREHDAFVLPCRPAASGDRDGIPVALMEAMAGGLPTLAGDLPAIGELIVNHVTGRLVKGGSPPAVAAVLTEWAADPGGRTRLGEAGRRHVADEFSLAVNIHRLESALHAARPEE